MTTDISTKESEGLRLFAVSMIRNDGDIILPFLRQCAELFDSVLIADVQSTDGTELVLRDFSDPRLQLKVYKVDRQEKYQSAIVNCLSREAFAQGADWVFFLDGDEFIDVPSRVELERYLREVGSDVLFAPWINLVPSHYGTYGSFDVTQKFYWSGRTSKFTKVAISSLYAAKNPDYVINEGNHTVQPAPGADPVWDGPGLPLLHLPVRSLDRFKVKIVSAARLSGSKHNRLQGEGSHVDELDKLLAAGTVEATELNHMAAHYGDTIEEKRTLSPAELDWPTRQLPAYVSMTPTPDASPIQLASLSETLRADSLLTWSSTEFIKGTAVSAVIDGGRLRIVPQPIAGDGRLRSGRYAALGPAQVIQRSPHDLLVDVVSASCVRVKAYVFSAWSELIPVMYTLFVLLRPRRFVELGVHNGMSFFSACQVEEHLGLGTECVAVDSWVGDEHAGFHGNEVFDGFRDYLRKTYPRQEYAQGYFSTVLDCFEDGSIDLLHIDGLHTYEAVKKDFETWLPKLSDVGVIIFHDTNVLERNFGVWRLWEELRLRYPAHNFAHQHGLGIIYVGRAPHPFADLLQMLSTNRQYTILAQAYFEAVGRLLIECRANLFEREQAEYKARLAEQQNANVAAEQRNAASTQLVAASGLYAAMLNLLPGLRRAR